MFMAMSKDVGICHILMTVVSNRDVLVLIMFHCNKYQIAKSCLELNVVNGPSNKNVDIKFSAHDAFLE
jgi:hypothetical protein